MFHGNGGNAGHRIPLGMMFQQVMRCNVLGLEYRGYGDSTGSPSESGFAIDAVTALEFVRGDTRLRDTPVVRLRFLFRTSVIPKIELLRFYMDKA